MMRELRCENKKHAVLTEEGSGLLEVKCDSRFCGARAGVIVLHTFELAEGKLVETNRYKEIRSNHGRLG